MSVLCALAAATSQPSTRIIGGGLRGRGVRAHRLDDMRDTGRDGRAGREGLWSGGRDEREAEGRRDERGGDGGGAAGEPGHCVRPSVGDSGEVCRP
ncbi:hypothetical protein [Dactylosporangium sp. NPDC048998]|uniref:hypothetical protein n=1 Tax=Dactylosporangium sp. NPDC048998 TaxID=3363976 RepID=UPI00371621DE